MQTIFLILFAIILICGIRPVKWNKAYLDKATTNTVNGFFIALVFLTHFSQYVQNPAFHNFIGDYLGQLVVVPFLFYSGYGCYVQYVRKGAEYLNAFPIKRVLATLVNFDIAVCVFVFINLVLGVSPDIKTILLSFVCWESVGNSNWYILAIILSYLSFWLSFKVLGTRSLCGLYLMLGLIVVVLSRIKPSWWYDTMMVFGAGVSYGIYRPKIEPFLKKFYWSCLTISIGVFFMFRANQFLYRAHFLTHNLYSFVFAFVVLMITRRIKGESPIFRWCGEHLFPLYIYQRIPMMVFSTVHPAAFEDWRCPICLAISLLIAVGFAFLYPYYQVSFPMNHKWLAGRSS